MDYKKIFQNKSDEEIIDLLESDKESINYDSKVSILQLIEERNILAGDDPRVLALKRSLENEEEKIRSLEYLRNLGFKHQKEDNALKIVRSRSAKFIDLLGSVIGFIGMLMFVPAFDKWRAIYETGLEILPLIFAVILTILGILGMMLFFKCATRFFEFAGFEILKEPMGGVKLSIRQDFKLNRYEIPRENLFVNKESSSTSLMYAHGNVESVLMSTHGGLRLEKTIFYLKSELTK